MPLAEVTLTIPSRPEYVGVARLAILGVASRMRFSYDEVEDIRLAVGEACTHAIDRLNGAGAGDQKIDLACTIGANRLVIEVRSPMVAAPARPRTPEESDLDNLIEGKELSGVLIRILMDEVETAEDAPSGRQTLRMVKYVAR